MEEERLTKRADVLTVEGRRGRKRLRWEECMKRDLVGVGEEGRMRVEGAEMAVKWDQ